MNPSQTEMTIFRNFLVVKRILNFRQVLTLGTLGLSTVEGGRKISTFVTQSIIP